MFCEVSTYYLYTVYVKNRRLHTTIFTERTDKQNYLHYKSEHPLPLKNSIPFGQVLRIKHICSEAKEFMKNCTKILNKFTLRGYPKIITQQAYYKTIPLQRNNLLKTKMKKRSQRISLVVTYNRTLPPLGVIVNKHWYILQSDQKMEDKFNERPDVEDHEDLWILKLGTLRPNGLNDKHPENAVRILYLANQTNR